MPSTDAPNWWADVQQEREDLAGARPGRRPADDWLGEDIDFVPRRRLARATSSVAPIERRLADADAGADEATGDHQLHGVFVPAASHAPVREAVATSRTIELTTNEGPVPPAEAAMAHELAHLSAADDPFATPPPPVGTRRTVQIKGRPTESRLPSVAQRSMAQRHRGRTTSDRVGPRPDRIALWAVALGAILILLAAMTSSSQAAVRHAKTSTPAISAKVAHAAHHAPLRAPLRHR
jgi:hypothetical protein